VDEGFARVHGLIVPFITLSGARTLDGGQRACILCLLGFVPDNLIIRFGSIGGKASLALSQILRRL
jgi:hypothetical protein